MHLPQWASDVTSPLIFVQQAIILPPYSEVHQAPKCRLFKRYERLCATPRCLAGILIVKLAAGSAATDHPYSAEICFQIKTQPDASSPNVHANMHAPSPGNVEGAQLD